ncbi:(2Fe-2S)-binding protein [Umezawaea beigongshangensis]|uniref:(2Fe-2S)-binding protein n=1 Tax=Umezawaea beigongshangensis TaxID=2780383 RepID=UPI0018F17B52|nr:(2Fe-2S)-binding protein [Umezawaea beigongshangensis]
MTWPARCDEVLPRRADGPVVPWAEFCDPDAEHLRRCAQEWQRRGGFAHRRAGIVLIAFRAGWLGCCATVPEIHFGLPLPALSSAGAVLGEGGRLAGLRFGDPVDDGGDGDRSALWWRETEAFFAPLARGLAAIGGPRADAAELWGNPVGLIGAVAARLASAGAPGDLLGTARALRDATGRAGLLSLRGTGDDWTARRRTCCQWWRAGGDYCAECVLHDSPARSDG